MVAVWSGPAVRLNINGADVLLKPGQSQMLIFNGLEVVIKLEEIIGAETQD